MNRIRIGRPRARTLSPDPQDPDIVRAKGAHADRAFRKGARDVMAWAGRRLWLAVQTVIRAVRMAHDEQVRMWECVLLTSGAVSVGDYDFVKVVLERVAKERGGTYAWSQVAIKPAKPLAFGTVQGKCHAAWWCISNVASLFSTPPLVPGDPLSAHAHARPSGLAP